MEGTNQSSSAKSDDRLSSLPDSLLCHILSFLPTKLSVATSILATRWRFLWADVLNLDFDSSNHKPGRMSFTDTITRVMLLSNVRHINTFRLRLKNERFNGVHLFESWIRTTIARNVEALDIELLHQTFLPRCLFTCKTLVDLRLRYCGSLPDAVILPNLKKLHLHYFEYGNHEKLQNLIFGCPVLEELKIQGINEYDLRSCIISSPTIKWLTLILDSFDLEEFDYEDDLSAYKLEINTPAVRYLVVRDYNSQRLSTGIFNSLVEAKIYLNNVVVQNGVIYSSAVLELVERVCQVKCLTLSIGYNQFLDSSFAAATSKFITLTKLELAADWRFLLKFLESADILEVLIIRQVDHKLKCWTEPQQVPTCLSSHLRQVTIDSFGCSENEFKMVSYILRNGKVLNLMDIDSEYTSLEKKFNALQRISAFERRSETSTLQFS